MTALQQYQLWIGLGFAAALVIFLFVAFFTKERLSDDQRQILRFLCALCAGFSGALITGDALFKLDTGWGETSKLAVSGTAGAALLFTVWFTFKTAVPPPDAYNFSLPSGWTFEAAVKAMAQQDGAVAEFVGFTDEEKNTLLKAQTIKTSTLIKAIQSLRLISDGTAIREYLVERDDHILRMTIKQ